MQDGNYEFKCSNCGCTIKGDYDFCSDCGTLFTEGIKYINHQGADAKGVCVICCEPFCQEGRFTVNNFYFICESHVVMKLLKVWCGYPDHSTTHEHNILKAASSRTDCIPFYLIVINQANLQGLLFQIPILLRASIIRIPPKQKSWFRARKLFMQKKFFRILKTTIREMKFL